MIGIRIHFLIEKDAQLLSGEIVGEPEGELVISRSQSWRLARSQLARS